VTAEPTPTGHATAATGAAVYVHVAGAVRAAGLYRLEVGDRVADAIARAGGVADDAARDGVNLARTVTDGEQIVVPVAGATPDAAGPG
ncbi:SLBB domain-containing protein, partial [Acinetobacter baumannii]